MTITEFKARALAQIDRIARTREDMVITKHGRPVARVVPYTAETGAPAPGTLTDMFSFEEDIVSPLGETLWQAAAESQSE